MLTIIRTENNAELSFCFLQIFEPLYGSPQTTTELLCEAVAVTATIGTITGASHGRERAQQWIYGAVAAVDIFTQRLSTVSYFISCLTEPDNCAGCLPTTSDGLKRL